MLIRFPRLPDEISAIFKEWAAVSQVVDTELAPAPLTCTRVRWQVATVTIARLSDGKPHPLISLRPNWLVQQVTFMVQVMAEVPRAESTEQLHRDVETVRTWLHQLR